MTKIDQALQELQTVSSTKERLAILEAIDKKRREDSFIRYWVATPPQVDIFKAFTADVKIFGILGGNRCLAGSTEIAVPGGKKTIESIQPGDLVYATDGSPVRVLEKYHNGPKEVFRFYGKKRNREVSLDCTIDHKVIGANQKNLIPTLKPIGEWFSRNYFVLGDGQEFGKQEYPLALLIGLLLGDGCIQGKEIQWTCAEPELVELLRGYIESFGYGLYSRGIQHRILAGGKSEILRDSLNGQILGTKPRHSLIIELKRLGLWGTNSRTKFIPPEVWNWQKADVASLLGGLIATDGSVFRTPTGWSCNYTSISRELIEGIKKLLSDGFGIYGSVVCKGSKGCFSLSFGNSQALKRLAELPIPGRKGRLLKEIVFEGRCGKGSYIPLVDKQLLGELETFDILIDHPSHVFQTVDNIQIANSGKTELGAFLATAWALGKEYFRDEPAWEYVKDLPIPPPPNNVWVVGLDFPTLRDVIWREKLRSGQNHPPLLPKDSQMYKKVSDSDFQVFWQNGSVITGKSADSGREKFQGASIDLVWIDEEPEVDVYDECYQRTIDCGGKIVITLTPLADINSGVRTPWVWDLYEDAKRGQKNLKFVSLSMLDNPYIPVEEKEQAKLKWSGHAEEKARLYGGFVQRSGLVYSMWNPAVHMVPRFKIPREWGPWIVSIDPADTGTTAALWAVVDPFGNIYLVDEYYVKDQIISDHGLDIMLRNGGRQIDTWIIDPKYGSQRTGETHKSRLQLFRESMRVPIRLASVGEDFGLNTMREYLQAVVSNTRQPKLYVFNDLTNFRWEIEHYSWDFFQRGDMKGLSKDKPRKRNDHLQNACQYICAMRPRSGGKIVITPEERKKMAVLNSYT